MEPIEAAEALIGQHFPDCLVAFLAGSVIRGEGTSTSDLDVVVITEHRDAPFRQSLVEFGWPIEVFVHNRQSLDLYFAKDVERRRPALVRMCEEGIVIRDINGLASQIKEQAREILERGPEPVAPDQLRAERYALTDLLDDFVGCAERQQGVFIANDLAVAACDLILDHHGEWLGRGKWLSRRLRQFDAHLADHLQRALEDYFRHDRKTELIEFAEDALALEGGRLFDGYYLSGEGPSPRKLPET